MSGEFGVRRHVAASDPGDMSPRESVDMSAHSKFAADWHP